MTEMELQEILKRNPLVKVQGSNVKKMTGTEQYNLQEKKMKTNKYKNNRTKVDGILFDSQKEANTYPELELLLRVGEIAGYCRQAEFVLRKGDEDRKPITYRSDWVIFYNDGTFEIRDDKGILTDVYKLKRKMFNERFPKLEIVEKY